LEKAAQAGLMSGEHGGCRNHAGTRKTSHHLLLPRLPNLNDTSPKPHSNPNSQRHTGACGIPSTSFPPSWVRINPPLNFNSFSASPKSPVSLWRFLSWISQRT
jgi:hypothetical protein